MTGGPLAGIKVVEIAGIGPAPYACLLLAELGAEVVRIDRAGPPNPLALATRALSRSRRSVAVDLKSDEGVEVVLRLVERADVLIEGLRPGVLERLGLGPDTALARNPRLIYGRMTGWGQEGPLAQAAGHDLTYAALTGAIHAIGTPSAPAVPLNLVADFGGGALFLVVGVLAALQARSSGVAAGQVVDAAMVDGAASLLTMIYGMLGDGLWTDQRQANLLDGGAPYYTTYECADGRHVAVGALEPQFYAALLAGLGIELPGPQADSAYTQEHRALLAAAFATRPRDEWVAHFAGTDACVAPVRSLAEAPQDPHLRARGTFTQVEGVWQPRVAPRFAQTPGLEPTPPPRPGADTSEALTAWGFAAGEVEALLARGVIAQA